MCSIASSLWEFLRSLFASSVFSFFHSISRFALCLVLCVLSVCLFVCCSDSVIDGYRASFDASALFLYLSSKRLQCRFYCRSFFLGDRRKVRLSFPLESHLVSNTTRKPEGRGGREEQKTMMRDKAKDEDDSCLSSLHSSSAASPLSVTLALPLDKLSCSDLLILSFRSASSKQRKKSNRGEDELKQIKKQKDQRTQREELTKNKEGNEDNQRRGRNGAIGRRKRRKTQGLPSFPIPLLLTY